MTRSEILSEVVLEGCQKSGRRLIACVVVDAPSAARSRLAEVGHLEMMVEMVSHSRCRRVRDSGLVLQNPAKTVHAVAALTGFVQFHMHRATRHSAGCCLSLGQLVAETRSYPAATTSRRSLHLAMERVSYGCHHRLEKAVLAFAHRHRNSHQLEGRLVEVMELDLVGRPLDAQVVAVAVKNRVHLRMAPEMALWKTDERTMVVEMRSYIAAVGMDLAKVGERLGVVVETPSRRGT